MQEKVIGIYHKDCVDGTASAAVILKKFPHARLFPLAHGCSTSDIQHIVDEALPDTHIYIVDAVLGMHEFLAHGYSVTVIDHHVSVHNEVEKLAQNESRLSYIYDINKSGASLTWTYLFPNDTLPELIRYIEDSDLWRQEFGTTTKDVAHYLSIWRNDPAHMLELIMQGAEEVKLRGAIISQYTDSAIARLITIPPITLLLDSHIVHAFNITDHESACGNILSTKYDTAVALFTIKGLRVKLSFRSLQHHKPSALDLALTKGGGGHQNASGAEMSLNDFLSAIQSK